MRGRHGNHRRGPKVARVAVACEICGAVREYLPSQLRVRKVIRFCSIACRDTRRDNRPIVACVQCGRKVRKRSDHLAIQKSAYCSRACSHAARRVEGAEWRDPQAIKAYLAAYVAQRRERFNALSRQWSKANRSKKTAASQRYRARLKRATIERVDFEHICVRDGMTCHICKAPIGLGELSFDHIVPLSKGGAHSEANLAVCHRRCNSRKGDRLLKVEVNA